MSTQQKHTPHNGLPLVSFIIPCYDLPMQMLRDCIDSIRSLSLRPYEREILLIDDGSPVALLDQLSDYSNELIYIRQPHGGVSTARNIGMRVATGRYVQFVDGDDKLLRASYEHVLDIARYEKNDIIMFGFSQSEDETSIYEDKPALSGRELMRSTNIQGASWGYLFRKCIVGELTFTPGIAYGEDEEFTPQLLLRADSVVQTTAQAYYYRPRPSSAIHDITIRKRLQRLNDSKTIITRLNLLADTMPSEEHAALTRRVHQLTMDYIYNIILLTQNRHYLNRRLHELSLIGLYPLPDRNYTQKYSWFRRLANNELGISMLMKTIPLMNKEK